MSSLAPVILDEAADFLSDSVKVTLNSMFNVDVDMVRGAIRARGEDDYLCSADLKQPDAFARLNFSFDRELMHELVRRIFSDNDLNDKTIYESAACEVANVVCSNLKTFLNGRGYDMSMDVPHLLKHSDFEKSGRGLENFIFTPQQLATRSHSLGLSFHLKKAS